MTIECIVTNSSDSIAHNHILEQTAIVCTRRGCSICHIHIYGKRTTATTECRSADSLNISRDNDRSNRRTTLEGVAADSCQRRILAQKHLSQRAAVVEGTAIDNLNTSREDHILKRYATAEGTLANLLNALAQENLLKAGTVEECTL